MNTSGEGDPAAGCWPQLDVGMPWGAEGCLTITTAARLDYEQECGDVSVVQPQGAANAVAVAIPRLGARTDEPTSEPVAGSGGCQGQ